MIVFSLLKGVNQAITIDLDELIYHLSMDFYENLIIDCETNIKKVLEYFIVDMFNCNSKIEYNKYKIPNYNIDDLLTPLGKKNVDVEGCIKKDLRTFFDAISNFLKEDYDNIYTVEYHPNNKEMMIIVKNMDFRIYEWELNKHLEKDKNRMNEDLSYY